VLLLVWSSWPDSWPACSTGGRPSRERAGEDLYDNLRREVVEDDIEFALGGGDRLARRVIAGAPESFTPLPCAMAEGLRNHSERGRATLGWPRPGRWSRRGWWAAAIPTRVPNSFPNGRVDVVACLWRGTNANALLSSPALMGPGRPEAPEIPTPVPGIQADHADPATMAVDVMMSPDRADTDEGNPGGRTHGFACSHKAETGWSAKTVADPESRGRRN
jgi:hypothetical protein